MAAVVGSSLTRDPRRPERLRPVYRFVCPPAPPGMVRDGNLALTRWNRVGANQSDLSQNGPPRRPCRRTACIAGRETLNLEARPCFGLCSYSRLASVSGQVG